MLSECANNKQRRSIFCTKTVRNTQLTRLNKLAKVKSFNYKKCFYLFATMKMCKVFVVLLMISSIVLCAEAQGMRRKVRRKVLRRPVQQVVEAYEAEITPQKSRAIVLETEEPEVPEVIEVEGNEPAEEEARSFAAVDEDRYGRG